MTITHLKLISMMMSLHLRPVLLELKKKMVSLITTTTAHIQVTKILSEEMEMSIDLLK
jgi:hypothetical protein